jgi:hypothetical protein
MCSRCAIRSSEGYRKARNVIGLHGLQSLYTAAKRPHCNMTVIAAQRRLFGNCDLDHADRRQWDHVTQPHAIGDCETVWDACITIDAPHDQINQVSRTLS